MENKQPDDDRKPNRWNDHQKTKKRLKEEGKKDELPDYVKVEVPKDGKTKKTRYRCQLKDFISIVEGLSDWKKDVIKKTPFAKLLEFKMESESLTQKRDMVKSLARNFNYKNSTLIARKGRETQDIEIKADDFSKIMGIQDGSEAVLDKEADNSLVEEAGAAVPQLSAEEDPVNQDPVIAELESKYCNVTKNGGYKGIAIKNVVNELKKTNDEDVTKQTFMLTAMHYIVCPAPGGVLSKSCLDYVKDANSLDKQPWATIAMNDLKYGVKNFVDGKGAEKNIGGCTLFLQLFCMSLRGFHDSLDFSKIDEKMIEEFYMTWMIDNGSENKRRKLLADKIVNDMKSVANLIKAKSDLLDLDLLLNLDESIQESQKKISAAAVANDEIEGVEHLSVQDLETLEPQKWLNDNVINFYISELKMKLKDNSAHYHIFNTFFYVKLQRYFAEKDLCTEKGIVASPFEKVRRWWGRDNILKKKYLVIPIHESSHWSVLIICMPNDTVNSTLLLHMDSYPSLHNSDKIFRFFQRFLEEESKYAVGEVEAGCSNADFGNVEVFSIEVPHQPNLFDCGVYALLFVQKFIEHAPEGVENKYQNVIGKTCFGIKEVNDLRINLKESIRKVIAQQKPKETRKKRKAVEIQQKQPEAVESQQQVSKPERKKRRTELEILCGQWGCRTDIKK